jgi:hypothetical protein
MCAISAQLLFSGQPLSRLPMPSRRRRWFAHPARACRRFRHRLEPVMKAYRVYPSRLGLGLLSSAIAADRARGFTNRTWTGTSAARKTVRTNLASTNLKVTIKCRRNRDASAIPQQRVVGNDCLYVSPAKGSGHSARRSAEQHQEINKPVSLAGALATLVCPGSPFLCWTES